MQNLTRSAVLLSCLRGTVAFSVVSFTLMTTASACSVPVFRYALEHWQPDPYFAIVFHRGELTEEQQATVELLQSVNEDGKPRANVVLRTIDLETETSAILVGIWEEQQTDGLPYLVLKAPPKEDKPLTVWSCPFTTANASVLLQSPVRQKLSERLLRGDSVVWVYLEGGDTIEDDASFALLEEELKRLEGVIELPPIAPEDLAELSIDPDSLMLAFSAIRVSRDNPAERGLISMLLHVEPDLLDEEHAGKPMAFPVFARGRALYALVGDGITVETIEEASRFLTGECQCTIKRENPGVDLLMNVDWDAGVTPIIPVDESSPTLSGLAAFRKPVVVESKTMAVTPGAVGPQTVVQNEDSRSGLPPVDTKDTGHTSTGDTEATTGAGATSLGGSVVMTLVLLAAGIGLMSLFVIARPK